MLLISHNEEFLRDNTTRILTMEGGGLFMTIGFEASRSEEDKVFMPDPRTKLVLIVCLSSMAVFMNHLILLGALFLISLLLLLLFRVNVKGVWKRTRALLVIVVFIALAQSLFGQGGQALITLGRLELLTTGGLILAGEFILRMLIIFTSACILTTCGSRMLSRAGTVEASLRNCFHGGTGNRFIQVFGDEFGMPGQPSSFVGLT